MQQTSELLQSLEAQMCDHARSLALASSLLVSLVRVKFGLDQQNFECLDLALDATSIDSLQLPSAVTESLPVPHAWIEYSDASLTNLLRTSLAKNSKESSSMPSKLELHTDTTKFKRHLQLVLDRISKGMRPVLPKKALSSIDTVPEPASQKGLNAPRRRRSLDFTPGDVANSDA